MDDAYYMRMALTLAERGRGFTSPNPMVGAVVVQEDRVVGMGWHRRVGGAHAEVNALDDAGEHARGATLYVTLEPCRHTGRTPPCTGRVLAAGVSRVVTAMQDPNPEVTGGGNAFLAANGIVVENGICGDEARRLNEVFIKHTATGRPFVTVKCAATLDGRIATRTGDSRWVTGPAARAYVHRLRHASDGILVGLNTVIADDPSLTTRLPDAADIPARDPVRIILDTRLEIPETARVLQLDSEAETIIICADSVPLDRRQRIAGTGAQVVAAPTVNGRIDMGLLMDTLAERGITSLLIEGGGRVIGSALTAGIVDKVLFFYAPNILGGDDGIPMCAGTGPERMADSIRLHGISTSRFGEDILVEGYL